MNLEIPFKKTKNSYLKMYINIELSEETSFSVLEKKIDKMNLYHCRFPSLRNKRIIRIILSKEENNEKVTKLLNNVFLNFVKNIEIRFE